MMITATENIKKARAVSGIALERAAYLCGIGTYQTYAKREENPGSLSISELKGLFDGIDNDGKLFIVQFLEKNFAVDSN
jgi:hypothetical protein